MAAQETGTPHMAKGEFRHVAETISGTRFFLIILSRNHKSVVVIVATRLLVQIS